jgi:hypothetical protein
MRVTRGTLTRAAIAIVLVAATSAVAAAQGRGGGGRGGRRGGESGQAPHQSDDQSGEWSGRFEDMASTKPVLKDVRVEKTAKDSINRIEKTYKDRFRTYANAAKRAFDDAHAKEQLPSVGQLDTLMQDARKLQDQEYAELRQLLAEDQRARFDANVVQRRADDDKDAAEHRRGLARTPDLR